MFEPSEIAERIRIRLKEQRMSITSLLQDCGLNKNAMYTMQNSGYLPRLDSIAAIAEKLDCSVDYLVGNTDTPSPPENALTEPEQHIVDLFRKLSPQGQAAALATLQGLAITMPAGDDYIDPETRVTTNQQDIKMA